MHDYPTIYYKRPDGYMVGSIIAGRYELAYVIDGMVYHRSLPLSAKTCHDLDLISTILDTEGGYQDAIDYIHWAYGEEQIL